MKGLESEAMMKGNYIGRREDETGMVLIVNFDGGPEDCADSEVPVNAATYQAFAKVPRWTEVRVRIPAQGPYADVWVKGGPY